LARLRQALAEGEAEAFGARRGGQVAEARAFPFGQDPAIGGVGQPAARMGLTGIEAGDQAQARR
jgi:hypothetical protein